MLLPMNTQYAFNHSEIAILPCKPTHPDVKVSLYREGLAGRGWENVVSIYSFLLPNYIL